MPITKTLITAPSVQLYEHSEAEIFGGVVWMALQAKYKKDLPLRDLNAWLVPALRQQQYVFMSENNGNGNSPVAFMSWANLSEKSESFYVANPDRGISQDAWSEGDRMWIIDWMTPQGHSRPFSDRVQKLFTNSCFRSLYHRGSEKGLRVMYFRGNNVTLQQAKQWWRARPIVAKHIFELGGGEGFSSS
jgi:cytolysin-activating lysine-acyltransferase